MKNNYSWGRPGGDYDTLLRSLSLTSVNSGKTSSIPLAEFWHPNRNKELREQLLKTINIAPDTYDDSNKIFEYATQAYKDGVEGPAIQYSGPSMTDLMIIGEKMRITIEAKYTEYSKDSHPYTPSIGEWIEGHPTNQNRLAILNCWRRYIGLDKYPDLVTAKNQDKDFPYQFLHRTASACFNPNDEERRILLYQLFWDSTTKEKLGEFEKNLKNWAYLLKLKEHKLDFYIAEIEIDEDENNSPAIKLTKTSKPFLDMIDNKQYSFKSIVCKDGYSLKSI